MDSSRNLSCRRTRDMLTEPLYGVRIEPDLKKLGAHGDPGQFFSKLARQLWVILAATRTRRGIAYARIREEDCFAHICKVISM